MSDYSVELTAVTKTYPASSASRPHVQALRGIDLAIASGEFFTLLGPSGCGKTTTLRIIAGFESADSGELKIQDQPMSGVPPYHRPVNTVFQNYALFPHLTVAQNVAFGLRISRVPRDERERRVQQALSLVQLKDLGDRRPSQLSGGQQQRVALARALVNRPTVLLLDEPLGALDLKLRKAMQLELKQLQEQVGITFIYVTHDQEEALTMSDRIAVMNEGRVLQIGDPVTLYEHPAGAFVAGFIGESNFLPAAVESVAGDLVHLRTAQAHFRAPKGRLDVRPDQSITFSIRPEKLHISPQGDPPPAAGATESIQGVVKEVVYIGTDTRYIVELPRGNELVVREQNSTARPATQLHKGDPVRIHWQPDDGRILLE